MVKVRLGSPVPSAQVHWFITLLEKEGREEEKKRRKKRMETWPLISGFRVLAGVTAVARAAVRKKQNV
jgi:hypothetical protein